MRPPWPFRRHGAPPAGGASTERPGGAWAALPPLVPTSGEIELTARSQEFLGGLSSRRETALASEPLGHEVRLEAPSGLVSGIARVVERSGAGRALELVPRRVPRLFRRRAAAVAADALPFEGLDERTETTASSEAWTDAAELETGTEPVEDSRGEPPPGSEPAPSAPVAPAEAPPGLSRSPAPSGIDAAGAEPQPAPPTSVDPGKPLAVPVAAAETPTPTRELPARTLPVHAAQRMPDLPLLVAPAELVPASRAGRDTHAEVQAAAPLPDAPLARSVGPSAAASKPLVRRTRLGPPLPRGTPPPAAAEPPLPLLQRQVEHEDAPEPAVPPGAPPGEDHAEADHQPHTPEAAGGTPPQEPAAAGEESHAPVLEPPVLEPTGPQTVADRSPEAPSTAALARSTYVQRAVEPTAGGRQRHAPLVARAAPLARRSAVHAEPSTSAPEAATLPPPEPGLPPAPRAQTSAGEPTPGLARAPSTPEHPDPNAASATTQVARLASAAEEAPARPALPAAAHAPAALQRAASTDARASVPSAPLVAARRTATLPLEARGGPPSAESALARVAETPARVERALQVSPQRAAGRPESPSGPGYTPRAAIVAGAPPAPAGVARSPLQLAPAAVVRQPEEPRPARREASTLARAEEQSEPAPSVEAADAVSVQRAAETGPAPGAAAQSPQALDELAGRIYDRIRSRLRDELLVDRERAGLVTDVR